MVRFFHVGLVRAKSEPLVDVSLSIGNGEAVLIHGPCGAGKSTLLRLLLGLESPTRGWITVDGLVVEGSGADVLSAHRRRIAAIPQRPALVPRLSALDNVALARTVAQIPLAQAREEAMQALERIGAAHLAGRQAASLSAGECQWVSIARALVREDSSLIVADEPASELDAVGAATFGEILAQEQARGKTLLLTSRTAVMPGLARHRVVVLEQGRVVLDTAEIDDSRWEEEQEQVA